MIKNIYGLAFVVCLLVNNKYYWQVYLVMGVLMLMALALNSFINHTMKG